MCDVVAETYAYLCAVPSISGRATVHAPSDGMAFAFELSIDGVIYCRGIYGGLILLRFDGQRPPTYDSSDDWRFTQPFCLLA
eukprot:scaffold71402_cov38-Prasinocladus_malaysianus.AAC.1